jgi:hypothetical protein
MIVAWEPSGTIRNCRVVLMPDETLPLRFNVKEAIVYREVWPERVWVIVKDRNVVLPADSDVLTKPAIPEMADLGSVVREDSADPFEHRDIIRFDEEEKK